MADLAPSCENRSSRLEDLTAQATARYSTKDYDAAAELYAHATELQADINGEMSMHNADLLYAYGRCLFHVAIKNSDVLGTRVIEGKPAESPVKPLNRKRLSIIAKPHNDDKGPAEEELLKVVEESNGATKAHSNTNTPSKPYFQFAGDENFDISEDDVDESEFMDGEESEEEEDDFANAFEVLDLARVLLQQRIQDVEQRSDKSKNKGDSSATKSQELLADVYDLQAEISLEGERFPDAATDLKSALELKMTLYPKESSIIAEAHYKLALALEFSSMTQHTDDHGELNDGKVAPVDFKLREEAVTQMEAAIASCKVRIGNEQERLQISSQTGGEDNESNTSSKDIEEVKGLVIEMEQRLTELRENPAAASNLLGSGTVDGTNPLAGILGSLLGDSPAAQKAKIEDATKGAKDLTSLVKKKRALIENSPKGKIAKSSQIRGKRRADTFEERGQSEGGETAKRRQV